MGKILTYAVIALMLAAIAAGCASEGCTDNQTCVPRAGFYSYNTGSKVTIDSIQLGGVGAPNDSLLIKRSGSQTQLPLRANRPSASFFVRYTARRLAEIGLVDTITIDYATIPYFTNEDCGPMYRYAIESVTHTREIIDSIAVVDTIITNLDVEQIKIFFRTSQD